MIIEIKQRFLLICYLATLLFPMVSCSSEASPRKQRVCIQQMSGFPNEESGFSLGVSACYAGIIGDWLIIAGGCNFPGKPVSEGGEKRFYQGIYSAKITSDTTLVWSQVGELPFPAAYGVSISHSGKLFIIGGNNSERSFSSVFSISLTDSGKAVLDTLPSLPVTLDNMAGAILDNTLYVVGGNENGIPASSVYSFCLDAPQKGWREEIPFPGVPRVQPVCAVQNGLLFIWGGFCPRVGERDANVAMDGYCYQPLKKVWEPIMGAGIKEADEKLTLTGGTSTAMSDSLIVCTGGVNKDIFWDAISGKYSFIPRENYLTQPVDWYRFNKNLMVYDIRHNCWATWGEYSCLARAGAVAVGNGRELFIIGGELKPGIRTTEIDRLIIE